MDWFQEDFLVSSSDTTDENNIDFTPEFLIYLAWNLDPENGHCNCVKYMVNNLLERVIEVSAVNGSNPGSKLLVPRIIMINLDTTLPFSLRRRQNTLRPAFVMTANESQSQTLA